MVVVRGINAMVCTICLSKKKWSGAIIYEKVQINACVDCADKEHLRLGKWILEI